MGVNKRATLKRCLPVPILFLALAARGYFEQSGHWRVFRVAQGFPESAFRSVTIAGNRGILAVNANSTTVCQFDGYDARAIALPDSAIERVYQSPAGQLWTISSRGLWTMKEGAWSLVPAPEFLVAARAAPPSQIPLCPVRQNVVLCLLPDRLIEVNIEFPGPARIRTLRSADQTKIGRFLGMAIGAGDELWISGQAGLARVSGPTRSLSAMSQWRELLPPPALGIGRFQKPEPDEGGVTMLAVSSADGRPVVARCDGERWQTQESGSLKIRFAWRAPDHSYWAADANSLFQLGGPTILTNQEMSAREYFDVGVDWHGTFWLATSEGLVRFTPPLWRLEEPESPARSLFPTNRQVGLKPLGTLRDGRMCYERLGADGSREGGRLEAFDGVVFQPLPFSLPDIGSNGDISCLLATQTGDLWLGGNFGTAWLHNGWTVFPAAESGAPADVSNLSELPNGQIWGASREKIWTFDGRNWFVVRGGFNHINAMICARDGSVWVGSDAGVERFFRGNWIENGLEEGLAGGVVRALSEDPRSGIWAATVYGQHRYHPEADTDPPRTFLPPVGEKEKNIPEDGVLTVFFSGRDKWQITPGRRLLFSHRLDEGEWSSFAEGTSVTLSDLAAGKHYFQVRAMDRAGNVDPEPAHLEFAVVLPWYKESRLVLIGSAGAAAAVFFAVLAYKRHRQLVLSYAEVEKQVAERTRELGLASQELVQSQKMRALGTLAAGIAHDFNNILSIIKGSVQIIEDNLDKPEKIRTRADRIKTMVDQGSAVVQAMLGFSRGSDEMLEECDLNPVVDNTIKLLGDRFLREVDLRFERAPDLPPIHVSRSLIQQILLNFIFNAAESMSGRKRIIITTARAGELPVGLALPPGAAQAYVSVSVRDFGCGIAPENMPRVFEPFFTTKALSTRRGTGLGLSIVYELAKKMEAGLALQSTVGEGSVFSLILPAQPRRQPVTPPAS